MSRHFDGILLYRKRSTFVEAGVGGQVCTAVGHRILSLCSAADLFKEFKAFEASMSKTASLSSASNI